MTTPPEIYSETQDHSLEVEAIASGIATVQRTDGRLLSVAKRHLMANVSVTSNFIVVVAMLNLT